MDRRIRRPFVGHGCPFATLSLVEPMVPTIPGTIFLGCIRPRAGCRCGINRHPQYFHVPKNYCVDNVYSIRDFYFVCIWGHLWMLGIWSLPLKYRPNPAFERDAAKARRPSTLR